MWRSQLTLTKTSGACPSHMIVGSPQPVVRNHQPTLAGTPLMEVGQAVPGVDSRLVFLSVFQVQMVQMAVVVHQSM